MVRSLTVILTNYLRPTNVLSIIDVLCKQSVRPTIFVWDNSPAQDFHESRVEWIIRSSRNARCAPRWWMASHAGTDFVLIHDDDLIPAHPQVLSATLDCAERMAPFAVGASGVVLKPEVGYWQSKHVGWRASRIRRDVPVDIVKGCYFCCPAARLTKLGHLELDAEDDIAVSAWLGNRLKRPHLVLARLLADLFRLPEGEQARKLRAGHRTARAAARWRYFASR